jgi:hypothetical protein
VGIYDQQQQEQQQQQRQQGNNKQLNSNNNSNSKIGRFGQSWKTTEAHNKELHNSR